MADLIKQLRRHEEAGSRYFAASRAFSEATAKGLAYEASIAFADASEAFVESQQAWKEYLSQPDIQGIYERAGIRPSEADLGS